MNFCLSDRSFVSVSGKDSEGFLQNLITQDIRRASAGRLIYSCLLTPQGRYLHDFFVFKKEERFIIDIEAQQTAAFLKRLQFYKLRSAVSFAMMDGSVFASLDPIEKSFKDPRHPKLGYRSYSFEKENLLLQEKDLAYADRLIALGVPDGWHCLKPEVDTVTDGNLDLLEAVSWEKGCFVGQEVTARVHYRGLAKKRLFIVEADANLTVGQSILDNEGYAAGDIRAVDTSKRRALALLKVDSIINSAFKRIEPSYLSLPGKGL